jgi:hypothetical protein
MNFLMKISIVVAASALFALVLAVTISGLNQSTDDDSDDSDMAQLVCIPTVLEDGGTD